MKLPRMQLVESFTLQAPLEVDGRLHENERRRLQMAEDTSKLRRFVNRFNARHDSEMYENQHLTAA